MTELELKEYLVKNYPQETEDCEWKEYSNLKHVVKGHEGDDIVSYVSAISNMNGGCLVIGVKDGTLDITGIQNFHSYTSISIKSKLLQHCTNLPSEGLEIEEYVTDDTGKTVWVIKIPKHSLRLPVYVHGKAWQRYGDSLDEMDATRKDAILDEISTIPDWSAEIIADASLDDLDPEAILKARKEYVKRNPTRAEDEKDWDTITFLNKAKLTRAGKITRTALILLGKEESEHLLSPYVIKIRWSLKNLQNENKDYDILSMPLILSVDTLFNKVRNVKYRFVREGTMFPDEMLRYDVFNIREPLHNCIAHQDYSQCARIEVIEYEDDHLVFQNPFGQTGTGKAKILNVRNETVTDFWGRPVKNKKGKPQTRLYAETGRWDADLGLNKGELVYTKDKIKLDAWKKQQQADVENLIKSYRQKAE